MRKPRVFLDTSVLIAALLSVRGASYHLLNEHSDAFTFEINEYVFEEVRRSLKQKFAGQPVLFSSLVAMIGFASISTLQNPTEEEVRAAAELISKKDAIILASALGESDYLLTLDNEFFKPAIIKAARKRDLQILKPGDLIRALDL